MWFQQRGWCTHPHTCTHAHARSICLRAIAPTPLSPRLRLPFLHPQYLTACRFTKQQKPSRVGSEDEETQDADRVSLSSFLSRPLCLDPIPQPHSSTAFLNLTPQPNPETQSFFSRTMATLTTRTRIYRKEGEDGLRRGLFHCCLMCSLITPTYTHTRHYQGPCQGHRAACRWLRACKQRDAGRGA